MVDPASFEDLYNSAIRAENEAGSNTFRGFAVLGDLPNVGVAEEEVQPQGGITVLATVESELSIVSDSTDDALFGTGANAVLIQALDGNYLNGGQDTGEPYYEEVILMNGTTPVTASIALLRLQSMRVISAGSNGSSVGTLTASINANVQLILRTAEGQSKSMRITCPANYFAYTSRLVVNWSGNQPVRVNCCIMIPTIVANIATSFEQSITNQLGTNPLGPTFDLRCTGFRVGGGGTDPLDLILSTLLVRQV